MVFSRVLAAACVLAGSVVAMDLSELQRLDTEFANFEGSLSKSASNLAHANQPEAPKLGMPKFSSHELAVFAKKVRLPYAVATNAIHSDVVLHLLTAVPFACVVFPSCWTLACQNQIR